MRKFFFNWAAAFALLFLLIYSYFSFMGSLYLFKGEIWKALLFALIVIVIVIGCVYVMTLAKMTKFKGLGLAGQIVFGLLMLGVFIAAAIPFTSFIYAGQHDEEITKCIEATKESAIGMETAYSQYVDQRVSDYKNYLCETMPYTQSYEISPNKEIELRTVSLRRQLAPPSLDTIQYERKKWVENLSGMSIWNIMLPANLNRIKDCVGEWVTEYNNLSDISFVDSNFDLFEYDDFSLAMTQLVDKLTEKRFSLWAIIAALICFGMMLLPYWRAEGVPMPKLGGKKNLDINNDETPIE